MADDIFTQETVDKLNASALTFNEVVTSRAGGVASGAIIDQTLTPLGETTDTLKGRLDKLGVYVSGWTSTNGGTLTSPTQAFLNNTSGSVGFGNYYSWSGAFPKTVAPGTDPAAAGSGYTPRTDVVLREELASDTGQALIAGTPVETFGFLMKTKVLVTERRFTGGVDITSGTVSAVAAIQAAINYVYSNGGGIVECGLRGAKYLLDAGLVLKSKVWLRGVDFPVVDHNLANAMPTLLVTYGKGSESLPAIRQNQGSYLSGFNVEYPDQVGSDMKDPHTGAVQADPYPYGWFLTLNNQDYGTSNIDAAACGNMFIKNAYNGIKYFRCGKYNLHDIYGQPLRRGLWIDTVLDVSRQTNIHFWTYHSVPGSLLYNWIKSNGEAYLLGRADQVTSISLFAYGYYIGRYFTDLEGGGSWWGDFYGCLMDVCTKPVVISSVNKVNDYGCDNTTANFLRPCLVTTTGAMPKDGFYAMHGGSLNGGSNLGAIISCSNGTFVFNNVNFGEKDSTGCKGASVVVESTARVVVSGGKLKPPIKVGGVNCIVDGVKMPSTDNQLTLSTDPNLPASWSLKSGTGTTTVNDSGVNFATTATSAIWDYTIPANAKGGYIGVVEFEVLDIDNIDKFLQLKISRSDGGELSSVLYSSISGASGKGDWLKIRQPVFQGELIDTQVVRLELGSYASQNVSVTIRNLKFYASSTVGDTTAQKVISDFCTVPSRFKIRSIRYASGLKEMTAVSVPATYNMNNGDYCRSLTPASGTALGWSWIGSWVDLGVRA